MVCACLTWLSCSTFIEESSERMRSVVSFFWTSLARRFEVEAVMPAFSCSRRSLSDLTRFAIGSRTVVAA